ncbi:MAG TPA: hypothetical protein PLF21_07215 [Exilispira sp.]|nr:hypothetical protein [Exilispira sp.]
MKFKNVSFIPEFKNDLKRLSKRFITVEEDLKIFIDTQLYLYHKKKIDNGGIFQIKDIQIGNPKIYKAKKFACRSLKGRGVDSGIRVIYAYYKEEDKIELIEIYFKGNKENEDRERILRYYKKLR